jgi:ribonuclease D
MFKLYKLWTLAIREDAFLEGGRVTAAAVLPPIFITTHEELREAVEDFRSSPRLAIDTESNGFYAWRERVCLVQISTTERDYIVDPLAVKDLSPLRGVMAEPSIEKVFHAGEYDVMCLKRDYGFEFVNLFDTMIAGRLLGFKELGLAKLIEAHFSVKLSKKFQKADWGLRPLSAEQVRYAQMDTHYLLRLSESLEAKLARAGRLEEAREAFRDLSETGPQSRGFDPEGWWDIRGRSAAPDAALPILRALYLFREREAERRDRASFRIMPDHLLLRIAVAAPRTKEDLAKVPGFSEYLRQRYSGTILDIVHNARHAPAPARPQREPAERMSGRERKLLGDLKLWRKTRAEAEGLDPAAVLSGSVLREMASRAARGESDCLSALSPAKRRRYGAELERLLKSASSR